MGSIIDYIECPNCSEEASHDFYYKSGEEYVTCGSCGYFYSATIINREKRLDELTDKDWKIVEIKKPYGSYRIKVHKDVGYTCGTLENKKQLEELKKQCKKDKTIETVTVSRFVKGKIEVETIIGKTTKATL